MGQKKVSILVKCPMIISEVEVHARVVLGVGKGVLFREVSSVQECPHRERGSTVYQKFIDVTLFLVNSVSEFSIIVQFDEDSKNCSELLVSYRSTPHSPTLTHPHTHTPTHTHTHCR